MRCTTQVEPPPGNASLISEVMLASLASGGMETLAIPVMVTRCNGKQEVYGVAASPLGLRFTAVPFVRIPDPWTVASAGGAFIGSGHRRTLADGIGEEAAL